VTKERAAGRWQSSAGGQLVYKYLWRGTYVPHHDVPQYSKRVLSYNAKKQEEAKEVPNKSYLSWIYRYFVSTILLSPHTRTVGLLGLYS
jgi:hypothetical protein